jgi:hypothetical protein
VFIQSSFSKLDGHDLLIPLWNRAPLNLSDNTQVYAALLDGKESAPAEVIITSSDSSKLADAPKNP